MAKKSVWEKNFASDPKVRSRVQEFFVGKLQRVRDERSDLEEKWLEFFRMWNVEKDGNQIYRGRSRLYVPEVRKNVEAQARQLTESAFPNDAFLSCYPQSGGTWKGADVQLMVRKHQIRQAQLRVKFHVFARQECLYGTSPALVPWMKSMRKVFQSAKVKGAIKPKMMDVEIFNGPDFVVADLFRWYALDAISSDFQNAGCFYDGMLDRYQLAALSRSGDIWNYSDLKGKAANALSQGELERFVEKVEASGLVLDQAGQSGEVRKGNVDVGAKMLATKIHTMMELPEACLDGEDPEVPIPVVIDIYNGSHIGCVKRNGFYHQQAPYVVGKYILPNAEEFYGQGIPWAIQYMQHEINSKAEQTMDSSTLALNPIAFVDPAMTGNMGDFEIEPGAIWWVSPQGVRMAQMPDTTPTGYAAIANLRSQMQDYSDRTPALPPQLSGKSRTATQSEIISSAMSVDIKSFQLQNEITVLQPLMEMWESLTDQNIEDKQILLLAGPDYAKARQVLVKKNQLLGRYQYQWNASSITQNKAILSRQLIDVMKVYGSLPPEERSKVQLRLDELFRILVREGMNIPNVERLFGTEKQHSTDPMTELEMLKAGMEISVSTGDNDDLHMMQHDKDMKELSEDEKAELMVHVAEHAAQKEAKMRLAQMQAQQQAMMAQMQQEQGGRSVGSGNRTQLSPNASSGDMASGTRA